VRGELELELGRMASYVPEEVVMKILSMLPPKSLTRFKCVCKRWKALIGNPDFLSKNLLNHSILTQNPTHPLRLILFFSLDNVFPGKEIHSFRSYDSLHCASQTPLNLPPAPPHGPLLDIVACCNGLLCLWDVSLNDIFIWNPATSMTSSDLVVLPGGPSRRCFNDFLIRAVGFGFDSGSNDFKVVTVVDAYRVGWLEAEIYSRRSGSWRSLDMTVNSEMQFVSQGVALDGGFLWYNVYPHEDFVEDRIVAFDFSDEEFRVMQFPDARLFCGYGEYKRTLTELKGSVAMFVFPPDEFRKKKTYLDIWVMLEFGVRESWTRLLSIRLPLHLERPLGFWKNGELFIENSERQLVLYDLLAQTERNLQFEGYGGTLKVVDCNFVQFEGMTPCP
jgi:F-box interacting protein